MNDLLGRESLETSTKIWRFESTHEIDCALDGTCIIEGVREEILISFVGRKPMKRP